jgi:hypothetical protein
MKNSGNRNGENILSSWLPAPEASSSGNPSLESKKNASTWLGVQPLPLKNSAPTSPSLPPEEKTQTDTKIATQPDFSQTIIRMFSGEPTKVAP